MDTPRDAETVKAAVAAGPPAAQQPEPPSWRAALPPLRGRSVLLREPTAADVNALSALIGPDEAPRFGIVEQLSMSAIAAFIDRGHQSRSSGASFTYVIMTIADGEIAGLLQVRRLDGTFETSECECLLSSRLRRRDAFLEAAYLAGAFAFEIVGARRIESRVPLQDRRANNALKQLGAVQEAVLRRSRRYGTEYIDQALWAIMKEDWVNGTTTPVSRWVH